MTGARIYVVVKPSSKKPAIDCNGDRLTVWVREPAREGKANEACRKALAKALGVAASDVVLLKGARSKHKMFGISSFTPGEVRKRLEMSAASRR